MRVAESEDGLLFSTVHVYSPAVVTVSVCVYCAVTGSSNTVSVPSVTVVVESLVQVTVVAGPPVEIHVRICIPESKITTFPITVTSPEEIMNIYHKEFCRKSGEVVLNEQHLPCFCLFFHLVVFNNAGPVGWRGGGGGGWVPVGTDEPPARSPRSALRTNIDR